MTTQPETCLDCKECCFSWYYSEWSCELGDDDTVMLDNDIYTSVHDNCPLRKERDERWKCDVCWYTWFGRLTDCPACGATEEEHIWIA